MSSSDAPVAPARPLPVSVIGWVWFAAGTLRVVEDLLSYVIWRAGGLDQGLPPLLLARVAGSRHAVDSMVRHLGPVILVQAIVAAAIAWSAWKLLQLKPWARIAILTAASVFLLMLICVAALLAAGFAGLIHEPGWRPEDFGSPARRIGVVFGIGIPAVALFGSTIYYLRRADVRSAFRARTAGE